MIQAHYVVNEHVLQELTIHYLVRTVAELTPVQPKALWESSHQKAP